MVGERVFLQVSPMKGVMRFVKNDNLNLRYISPFDILDKVGEVAYKLALLPNLSAVHRVFHVSMLRKYYGDLSHILDFSSVQLDKDLTYVEESVAILDRQRLSGLAIAIPVLQLQVFTNATLATDQKGWE
ncbi:uncharacterized protein [Nicotiana tomentosiformis]|uniref:uncharacterized protein n=1 Tax=Nicotiana tomentosiformis TaxID=4098 RepID=UPI00388C9876